MPTFSRNLSGFASRFLTNGSRRLEQKGSSSSDLEKLDGHYPWRRRFGDFERDLRHKGIQVVPVHSNPEKERPGHPVRAPGP
jgi:hypothetical protein